MVMLRTLVFWFFCASLPAANMRYWVEPCAKPTDGSGPVCQAGDPELAQWAFEAWQKATSGHLTFEKTTEREKAHIRVYWTSGRGGLYGEARPIMVEGVRGAEVFVLPPPGQPDEQDGLLRDTIVYLTCLHETGHALGLPHTDGFADIMYSFQYGGDIPEYFGRYRRRLATRGDIRKYPGMSPDDRKRIVALFP